MYVGWLLYVILQIKTFEWNKIYTELAILIGILVLLHIHVVIKPAHHAAALQSINIMQIQAKTFS